MLDLMFPEPAIDRVVVCSSEEREGREKPLIGLFQDVGVVLSSPMQSSSCALSCTAYSKRFASRQIIPAHRRELLHLNLTLAPPEPNHVSWGATSNPPRTAIFDWRSWLVLAGGFIPISPLLYCGRKKRPRVLQPMGGDFDFLGASLLGSKMHNQTTTPVELLRQGQN